MPTSVITAIRVQDIAAQKWFNWDDGAWDSAGQPVVTAGAKNLYIAAYVVQVEYGVVGLSIKDDTGAYLATKSELNPGTMGVEAPDLTMPNRNYDITVVTTGPSVTFTIKPLSTTCPTGYHWDAMVNACVIDSQPGSSTNMWIAIGAISIVAVIGVILLFREH